MKKIIPPVPCPNCDERQNVFDGALDVNSLEAGSVQCLVCGYQFEIEDYKQLVDDACAEMHLN